MSYNKWRELERHVEYLWGEASDACEADGVSGDVGSDDEGVQEDRSFVVVASQKWMARRAASASSRGQR